MVARWGLLSCLEAAIVSLYWEVCVVIYCEILSSSFPVTSFMVVLGCPTTLFALGSPGKTATIQRFPEANPSNEVGMASPRITPVISRFNSLIEVFTISHILPIFLSLVWQDKRACQLNKQSSGDDLGYCSDGDRSAHGTRWCMVNTSCGGQRNWLIGEGWVTGHPWGVARSLPTVSGTTPSRFLRMSHL